MVDLKNNIYSIILNRPETKNALDNNMLDEIEKAISEAEQNDQVKLIVFKGKKNIFAAGADIKQLNKQRFLEPLIPTMQELYNKIENSSKVTVAVVDGFALEIGRASCRERGVNNE